MKDKSKVDYASAGVSLEASDEVLKKIKKSARTTFNANVLSDIGSFGGLFKFPQNEFESPVLVASTDSVGTKLKLAFASGTHTTVGEDIVGHCVNDILVQGARPLFFLDYIAVGKLEPKVVADVVSGISRACCQNDMPLLGGETAELPGFYKEGEYDLVGSIVGVVDQNKIVDGSKISEGDIILGLPSVGLHTNGYSLARKICFEIAGLEIDEKVEQIDNEIGRELMKTHKSYLKPVTALMNKINLHGMAHVTGGGIPGNLIRILPDQSKAVIKTGSWPSLPIFDFLQAKGGVSDADMYDAFNMGVGYIIVVDPNDAGQTEKILSDNDQPCFKIGMIEKGKKAVELQ